MIGVQCFSCGHVAIVPEDDAGQCPACQSHDVHCWSEAPHRCPAACTNDQIVAYREGFGFTARKECSTCGGRGVLTEAEYDAYVEDVNRRAREIVQHRRKS